MMIYLEGKYIAFWEEEEEEEEEEGCVWLNTHMPVYPRRQSPQALD